MEKSRALKSVFRISRTSCTKTKKPKSAELNPSNGRTSPDFQEHSKLVRLPQNIICIITDPLDTISKARLIQTCRYLRATLEPSLYRTLNLDKKSTCNRADLVHRTLQERPDLIPYIHTYSGPLVRTNLAPLPTWRDRFGQRKRTITLSETEAFNMRMHVLCKTISIRDLDFSDYVDWASDPRWKPVRNAVFKMELTRLVYCFKGFSRGLLQVLRSQPSLEVLDLGWSTPELAGLKETDIPKLASLRAMLPEAIEIVPGRPIEKLHIIFGRGETRILEGVFHRLSLSTRAITELHLHFESRWSAHKTQDLLRVLSRNLPDVEELTIKFSGAVSGTVLLEELPSFSFLRSLSLLDLDLTGTHNLTTDARRGVAFLPAGDDITPQPPGIDDNDWLCSVLKERCSSLVDIQYKPGVFYCCLDCFMKRQKPHYAESA